MFPIPMVLTLILLSYLTKMTPLSDENDLVMPDGTAIFEKPITDQYIYEELNLHQGELLKKEKIIGRN